MTAVCTYCMLIRDGVYSRWSARTYALTYVQVFCCVPGAADMAEYTLCSDSSISPTCNIGELRNSPRVSVLA